MDEEMMLNVKVIMRLDDIVIKEDGWNIKDGEALDYINRLALGGVHPYLVNEYRKYYFKAKQHRIEKLVGGGK
jgi:hypothetical protein